MAIKTLDQAVKLIQDCERARCIAGHRADFPYSQHDIAEAGSFLLKQLDVLKDEATLANRRFAASNARYNKLAKATGKQVPEEAI